MTNSRDEDVAREIRQHLELEAEELVADGLSERDARDAARRAFGNVTRTQQDVRAVWNRVWLQDIVQDIRYAFRMLRKTPGFSIIAVLTLGLGIGANTAMFSVVNGVILEPLGYPQPDQLMFLTTRVQGFDQFWVSSPEYFELTEISRSFSTVGAFRTGEANLAALDRPRRVRTAQVNVELLEALGVVPEHGRWFRRDETRLNGPAVVMLSHELWRTAFAARGDIVGRTIDVNGVQVEVVGVMPAGFDVMDHRIDVWQPLMLDPSNREEWNRNTHVVYVIGRLKDGVTREQADAELASLNASWASRAGVTSGHVFAPGAHFMQMEPLQDEIVGSAQRAIWALQVAVGFLMLIACTNLVHLLLARAQARGRELAVRTALGARRARLLAQLITEGLVLSVLGGALGVALAVAGVQVLLELYGDNLPRAAEIGISNSVLGFTLMLALLTGITFGLAPLVHVPKAIIARLLHEEGTRSATTSSHSMRRALVAAEVALAVVLVAGAGLMLRSVANLMGVDAGFDRARLVTFGVGLPTSTYPKFEQRLQLYQRLMDRLEALPGVEQVSAMSGLPPHRQFNGIWTDIEGYTPTDRPVPVVDYYQTVAVGYFDTMQTSIVRGRSFQPTDRVGAPVAVVNEAFARRFWKGLDPIGRQVRSHFGGVSPWITVVGVAKDVKQGGIDEGTGTELYFLLDQNPRIFPGWFLGEWGSGGLNLVLRSTLPVTTLQSEITRAVREADPSLPVIRLRAMDEVVRESLQRPRMLMHLFSGFAGLALLLAAIGTYGVLSCLVAERRREIGIRIALGADRKSVLAGVMGHGLKMTLVGLAAGLAGAFALTRLMESLLFEVPAGDPATLLMVAITIASVAAVASLLPAHRATRVDPIVVLKEE